MIGLSVFQLPARAGDGAFGPTSRATAQIRLVIPSTAFREAVLDRCGDRATSGYVPIVYVAPDAADVPMEGRFVRCPSGASVFVLPAAR